MTVRSALRAPVRAAVRAPIILRKRWTPAALFAQGQQGAWYEPKPEYLYQDAAGTVPVTADGDPVGYMRDLSGNGNHATQSTSAARPSYRTDGTLHWLEFDGVDDEMVATDTYSAAYDIAFICYSGGYGYSGEDDRDRLVAIGDGYVGDGESAAIAPGGSLRFNDGKAFWDSGAFISDQAAVWSLQMISARYVGRQNGAQFIDVDRVSQTQRNNGIRLGRNVPLAKHYPQVFYGLTAVEGAPDPVAAEAYMAQLAGVTL